MKIFFKKKTQEGEKSLLETMFIQGINIQKKKKTKRVKTVVNIF